MQNYLLKTIKRFKKDEKGVTLVEYGIGISLAIALGAGALTLLAGDISSTMGVAAGKMYTTDPGDSTSY
ncbi:Flp family type IVb pilin [Tropicimonas marinistellae]|uniref:Flp family type IVb pilin n=1 Tax=Tropicimonas marinistellae TaxID=1739787 RepID=UPI00082B7319|nr:hypothetical protein [Tropicimonas marinistellae]